MKPEENVNGVVNQNTPNQTGDLSSTTISNIENNQVLNQSGLNHVETSAIETLDDSFNVQPSIMPQTDTLQANFNSVPVPPEFETEEKKKKAPNKILIIILIIILIAGVGFGVYYFLFAARTNAPTATINVKDLKIELGEKLSENIDDYATISGYDKNSCKIDISEVSSDKVGAYRFYVTCGENKVDGTVIIDDTTKPDAVTNEMVVLPNATIKVEDFIDSCIDASTCTYKFSNEQEVQTALKTIGEYDISILVTDEYNNESTITAKLIVSNEAPVKYLTCTGSEKDVDEIYATVAETYKFGIDKNNNFYNAIKTSEFKFEELEDYEAIKNNYSEEKGINNTLGKATFNTANQIISLKSNKTLDEIKTELNITAGDMNTIQMFMVINGYTCQ